MRALIPWSALAALLAGCSGTQPDAPAADARATAAAGVSSSEQLHQAVSRLTSRRPEGTQVTHGPGDRRSFTVQQGLGQVIVARTNPDGTVSAKCVESEAASREFLGAAAQQGAAK